MPFDDDCDFPSILSLPFPHPLVERHIRYFFDVYPYLEPRMHLNVSPVPLLATLLDDHL